MFHTEFFPTPKHVSQVMIDAIRVHRDIIHTSSLIVLDPSAGKGDLLDVIASSRTNRWSSEPDKRNLYAIEINQELQYVLSGKNYPVIGDDFLRYGDPFSPDVIVMNPPFSNADEHILKAWEMVANRGVVCALLNSETLNNPYTSRRQTLANIIEKFGDTKHLGQVFKDAERSTDVDVSMVILVKPDNEDINPFENIDIDMDSLFSDTDSNVNSIAYTDFVMSLVQSYNATVEALKMKHRGVDMMRKYTRGISNDSPFSMGDERTINEELQIIKDIFWGHVFQKTSFGNVATSKFKRQFFDARDRQKNMSFTVNNVQAVMDVFLFNLSDYIKQCIVDVFDEVTSYSAQNSEVIVDGKRVDGWKTNKKYRINTKMIIPRGVSYDKRFDMWSIHSRDIDFYDDLDKALCFLSGIRFEDLKLNYKDFPHKPAKTIAQCIDKHTRSRYNNGTAWNTKFESEFFIIRIFKKGTVHLTFKSEDLRAKFNIMATQGKNELSDVAGI